MSILTINDGAALSFYSVLVEELLAFVYEEGSAVFIPFFVVVHLLVVFSEVEAYLESALVLTAIY